MPAIKKGTADVTRYIMLVDSAAGTPETGYTITDLDLQYTRNRTAPAAKADATALAATDSAHADNKAIQIDATSSPGLYRVDWPDAAFATGADKVLLVVSGTGLHPAIEEIDLVDGTVNEIYSDTTIIASDLVQVYSDTTIVVSDTTAIHSDTTIIASDVVIIGSDLLQVYSDTTIAVSDTTAIHSDTTIIASDLLQVYSDTTIIYSDTTLISSDAAHIESDVARCESKAVQVYSDTTIVVSDTTKIESDAAHIESDAARVESKAVQIYSDTTITSSKAVQIYSDTTIAVSKATQIYSDTAIASSKAVQIYSDTSIIYSDTTLISADGPNTPTKGVEFANLMFMMVDATDLSTPETSVTVTATISKDGGAFAACTNSASEVSGGWYKITLTSTEMDANVVAVKFTGTGCAQRNIAFRTQPT